MLKKEEILLISYFIVVLLLLTVFFVLFFYAFQRRKNKLLLEKWEAVRRYEQEIANSRLEIQEQTLRNIGMELHDNIGQLLSVAKMQLNMFGNSLEPLAKEQIKEIGDTVANSLKEVRSLSKSLNNDVIGYLGLEKSIQNELERLERLQLFRTTFKTFGESREPNPKDSVVLFRILQEFFSNVNKHAQATELDVILKYRDELHIYVRDNGQGFTPEVAIKGAGMFNMKSRAAIIGANMEINSELGKGTSLTIHYPFQKN